MLGTFAGALDARKIDAKNDRLIAEVRGEVETTEDGVLVIRRVHVRFLLKGSEDVRETVDRVHGVYAEKCPVYRSLRPAFQITSAWELVADAAA
jgi:uncharacterized OsmC-like protein